MKFLIPLIAALAVIIAYDMPSPCYSARLFGACTRAQLTALTTLDRKSTSVLGGGAVNWNDPRIIGR